MARPPDEDLSRLRGLELLIGRARLGGLLLGLVQFGLFTHYPPGVRPAGLAIAVCWGLHGGFTLRVIASGDDARLRRWATTSLVIDAVLLAALSLVLAQDDDPTNLFLPLLMVLEAASKRRIPGALLGAAFAAAVEATRALLRIHVHDLEVVTAEVTFFGGMMVLVALFAGAAAGLEHRARVELAASNRRLQAMRRLLRTGLAGLPAAESLLPVLQGAVGELALDVVAYVPVRGQSVGWPARMLGDPAVAELGTRALRGGERAEVTDSQGARWIAAGVGPSDAVGGTLLGRLRGPDAAADFEALASELQVLLRARDAMAMEEQYRAAAEELEGLRTQFLELTTHELRTPITVITGASQLLVDGHHDPATAAALTEAVTRQARRLVNVIDDLTTVQQLDRGHVGSENRPVVVADSIAAVLGLMDSADVTVHVEAGADHVVADPTLLRTVLRCLVDNAVEHGRGEDVRIDVRRHTDDTVIDVSDAGPGIPVDARERVFERITGAQPGHDRRGKGVGLPLARALAGLMGGDVELVDVPGRTCFRLRLRAA